MRSAAVVLLALAVVACGDDDAWSTTTAVDVATSAVAISTSASATTAPTVPTVSPPSPPSVVTTTTPTSVPAGAVVPQEFGQVAATVTAADGTVCELCLWLAESGDERELGLMYVTDLGGPDGMVFRYDSPTTAAFWMKNTVMPLSIAFYDQGGAYHGAFDMAPSAGSVPDLSDAGLLHRCDRGAAGNARGALDDTRQRARGERPALPVNEVSGTRVVRLERVTRRGA